MPKSDIGDHRRKYSADTAVGFQTGKLIGTVVVVNQASDTVTLIDLATMAAYRHVEVIGVSIIDAHSLELVKTLDWRGFRFHRQ